MKNAEANHTNHLMLLTDSYDSYIINVCYFCQHHNNVNNEYLSDVLKPRTILKILLFYFSQINNNNYNAIDNRINSHSNVDKSSTINFNDNSNNRIDGFINTNNTTVIVIIQ
jgi:hypothetical protein